MKDPSIPLNTFNDYSSLLTTRTELNVANALPDRIALVSDEQTMPDDHCVGVFASFLSSKAHGFELVYLALSPLEDETTQNTDEKIEFRI